MMCHRGFFRGKQIQPSPLVYIVIHVALQYHLIKTSAIFSTTILLSVGDSEVFDENIAFNKF